MLTSNRDRAEWTEFFGEPLLASAALDRLTHRAHFVVITGAISEVGCIRHGGAVGIVVRPAEIRVSPRVPFLC